MACAGRSVPAVGAVASTGASFSAGFAAGGWAAGEWVDGGRCFGVDK